MDIQFELPGGIGAEQESESWGKADAVFPGGPSFRGNGRAVRDAGASPWRSTRLTAGAMIKVRWLPDVSWQKEIRMSNRKSI
jgi:hypothetical protein